MAKDLDTLTKDELGQLFPIIISESQKEWAELFLGEQNRIIALLGKNRALRIEHIGSTAVPGLPAKPTIDILVEIPKGEQVEREIVEIMSAEGYHQIRDQREHLMLVKGYTPEGFAGQCYHLHLAPRDQTALWDRIYFRDYLKAHPRAAREYAALKQRLARRHTFDREAYTAAKNSFIEQATARAKNRLK
ncbi:GrpB family protein [Desulfogranum mediterraneum]|uniref:GrpB family protein n=1 Tax=Desulfogranum mediterraneum TaxID=160661 RepID=UPI0003FC8CF1|nr:GrpB family protein [Desulfogranum mediterraneum]